MNRTSVQDSIQQAITADLQAASQLLQLLQQEQQAVETRQRESLPDIVKAKTVCMNRIEQQANARYQLLQSLGRNINEKAWRELVEEQDYKPIQDLWQQLLETLEQCRHCNEVNGRLVNRGQQTLHYLLTVLRGQLNPPSLYNQRGVTESHQSGHSVTRA